MRPYGHVSKYLCEGLENSIIAKEASPCSTWLDRQNSRIFHIAAVTLSLVGDTLCLILFTPPRVIADIIVWPPEIGIPCDLRALIWDVYELASSLFYLTIGAFLPTSYDRRVALAHEVRDDSKRDEIFYEMIMWDLGLRKFYANLTCKGVVKRLMQKEPSDRRGHIKRDIALIRKMDSDSYYGKKALKIIAQLCLKNPQEVNDEILDNLVKSCKYLHNSSESTNNAIMQIFLHHFEETKSFDIFFQVKKLYLCKRVKVKININEAILKSLMRDKQLWSCVNFDKFLRFWENLSHNSLYYFLSVPENFDLFSEFLSRCPEHLSNQLSRYAMDKMLKIYFNGILIARIWGILSEQNKRHFVCDYWDIRLALVQSLPKHHKIYSEILQIVLKYRINDIETIKQILSNIDPEQLDQFLQDSQIRDFFMLHYFREGGRSDLAYKMIPFFMQNDSLLSYEKRRDLLFLWKSLSYNAWIHFLNIPENFDMCKEFLAQCPKDLLNQLSRQMMVVLLKHNYEIQDYIVPIWNMLSERNKLYFIRKPEILQNLIDVLRNNSEIYIEILLILQKNEIDNDEVVRSLLGQIDWNQLKVEDVRLMDHFIGQLSDEDSNDVYIYDLITTMLENNIVDEFLLLELSNNIIDEDRREKIINKIAYELGGHVFFIKNGRTETLNAEELIVSQWTSNFSETFFQWKNMALSDLDRGDSIVLSQKYYQKVMNPLFCIIVNDDFYSFSVKKRIQEFLKSDMHTLLLNVDGIEARYDILLPLLQNIADDLNSRDERISHEINQLLSLIDPNFSEVLNLINHIHHRSTRVLLYKQVVQRYEKHIEQSRDQRISVVLDHSIPLAIAQKTYDLDLRARGYTAAVEVLLYQQDPDFKQAFSLTQQLAEFTKSPTLCRAQQKLYRKIVAGITDAYDEELFPLSHKIVALYDNDDERRDFLLIHDEEFGKIRV